LAGRNAKETKKESKIKRRSRVLSGGGRKSGKMERDNNGRKKQRGNFPQLTWELLKHKSVVLKEKRRPGGRKKVKNNSAGSDLRAKKIASGKWVERKGGSAKGREPNGGQGA